VAFYLLILTLDSLSLSPALGSCHTLLALLAVEFPLQQLLTPQHVLLTSICTEPAKIAMIEFRIAINAILMRQLDTK